MKTNAKKTTVPSISSEKTSAKLLMKKMGIPKKDLKDMSNLYGISFTKIVELMQLSKYKATAHPEPCDPVTEKTNHTGI